MEPTNVLEPFLKEGYISLRPLIDPNTKEVVWKAVHEVNRGGSWYQDRFTDPDPEEALRKCLHLPEGEAIIGMPQDQDFWSEITEEAKMPSVSPPRDWHLPTRIKSLAGTKLPATELLNGVRCHWCHRERDPKDLTIAWNHELACLTDKNNCRQPSTGKPLTQSEAEAPFEKAAKNGHGQPTSEKAPPASKPTEPAQEDKPGRVFTCDKCGKKKRTKSTRGRLPKVCQACKAEEGGQE